MLRPLAVSAVTRHLSEQVYNHASQGRCVLTLGGDHSIAIGTIAGTARAIRERLNKDLAVIWVDAHADINTPETSESGNIHGMPVAWLTGLAKEEREDVFGWLGQKERIGLGKLVYIGLRDVDRGEKRILKENNIRAFSMHDIDKYVFPRGRSFEFRHPSPSSGPRLAQHNNHFQVTRPPSTMANNIPPSTTDTESAKSWILPSPTSAPTPRSTSPLTWTLSIRSGPPARGHLCAAASHSARVTTYRNASTRRAA